MKNDRLIGSKIGNIRITELIGRGAMGTVYAAWDEKLDRKVAVKAMRRDHVLYTRGRAQFLREARILSRLDHPNICGIYEFIEHEDRDLLVLELVTGENLRKYVRRGLARERKLELVRQLVDALVTAHLEGVVHRDLKPENLMVKEDGTLKVLDFGLGRVLDEELRSTVLLNRDEAASEPDALPAWTPSEHDAPESQLSRIIGTPGYMSPEQARGEVVTTASDLYALGLIVQEIFAESCPFDPNLDHFALLEMAARGESAPVSGIDADIASLIERLKSVAPAARPSALDTREKLQWILDKPRRRTRKRLIAGAGIALVLLFGVITVQTLRVGAKARQASREAERANREALASREVSDFLVDLFAISDPSEARGSSVTARELLDRGAGKITEELADQPLLQANLLGTIGRVYGSLGLYEDGAELLNNAIAIYRREGEDQSQELMECLSGLGTIHWALADYAAAREAHEQVLAVREKAFGTKHPAYASSLQNLGNLYLTTGDFATALDYHLRAYEIRKQVLEPNHPHLGNSLNSIGAIYYFEGDYDRALSMWEECLRLREAVLTADHPHTIQTMNNLAIVHGLQGDNEQAKQMLERVVASQERVLGGQHPDLASGLNNLGEQHLALSEYEEARRLFERAVTIQENATGTAHPELARFLFNLGQVHYAQGDLKTATELNERALRMREAVLDADHPDIGFSAAGLATCLRDRGDFQRAEELDSRALDVFGVGGDDVRVEAADTMREYARLLEMTGRTTEAAHWTDEAQALQAGATGDQTATE